MADDEEPSQASSEPGAAGKAWDKTKDIAKRSWHDTVRGSQAVGNAAAATAQTTYKGAKAIVAFGSGYKLFFWVALLIHIYDAVNAFQRQPGTVFYVQMMGFYIALAIWAFFILKPHGFLDSLKQLLMFFLISAICFFEPLLNLLYSSAEPLFLGFNFAKLLSIIFFLVPVWVVYMGTITNYGAMKGFRVFWIIIIIGVFVYFVFTSAFISNPEGIPGVTGTQVPLKMLADKVAQGWSSLLSSFATIPGKVTDAVYRSVDPEYQSEVDKNKGPEIGVYLKKFEPSVATYNKGDQIVAYADIQARSFANDVTVLNTCYFDTANRPGAVDVPEFTVNQYDFRQLVCTYPLDIYDSINLTQKQSYLLKFQSDFAFTTYAYMTYVFMDQNLYNTYKSKKQDINSMYNIPRTAEAVYTNGPVTLGLVDPSNPLELPYSVSKNPTIMPLVGITIKNKDQINGQVKRITALEFRLPKPLGINYTSCFSQGAVGFERDPNNPKPNDVNAYRLIKPLEYPLEMPYITIRCRMTLDTSPEDLLGKGISFDTVTVSANYTYRLARTATITILDNPIQ
jgi:hypothetical protein